MNEKQEDKVLYHYCSTTTMLKIIENKQLWMSDISRSNDYSELEMFMPGIFYAIEDAYQDHPFDFHYKNENRIKALRLLLHETNDYVSFTRDNGKLTSYVICFSERGDALSQWRGYADNGRGYSIGFSMQELNEYCQKQHNRISICPVDYIGRDKRDKIIHDVAEELTGKLERLREDAKRLISIQTLLDQEIEEVMLALFLGIMEEQVLDSLKYKWEAFEEEKEWRMFFKSISKDENKLFKDINELSKYDTRYDRDWIIMHGKMGFYSKPDCVITYYPIELKEISNKPVHKLFLGPKNNSYIQDIKLLFAKSRFELPQIYRSNITYR